jgi:hypothetical protein
MKKSQLNFGLFVLEAVIALLGLALTLWLGFWLTIAFWVVICWLLLLIAKRANANPLADFRNAFARKTETENSYPRK